MQSELKALIESLQCPLAGRYADQTEAFIDGYEAARADALRVIAAWNTRAEGDADHQREGVLRMYVVAFCVLIEGLADAADIDLAETEMTMEANGKQLAARSVEQMIADAKKLTGARAALKTSTGEGN